METFENLFNLCQIYLINFQLTYFMSMVKQGVKLCKLVLKKINNCIYKGEKNQQKYTGRWFRGQSTFRVQGLGKLNQNQVILNFNTQTATDAFTLQNNKLFFKNFHR